MNGNWISFKLRSHSSLHQSDHPCPLLSSLLPSFLSRYFLFWSCFFLTFYFFKLTFLTLPCHCYPPFFPLHTLFSASCLWFLVQPILFCHHPIISSHSLQFLFSLSSHSPLSNLLSLILSYFCAHSLSSSSTPLLPLCLPTVPETTWALPSFPLRDGPKREHREEHPQQLSRHAHTYDEIQPEGGGGSPRKPQKWVPLFLHLNKSHI